MYRQKIFLTEQFELIFLPVVHLPNHVTCVQILDQKPTIDDIGKFDKMTRPVKFRCQENVWIKFQVHNMPAT